MHYYSICIGYCAYNAEPIRPAPLGGGPRGVTKPIFLHSEEAVASLAVHPTRGVNSTLKWELLRMAAPNVGKQFHSHLTQ